VTRDVTVDSRMGYRLAFTIAFIVTLVVSALMPAAGPIAFVDREGISQKALNGWPVFSTKIPPAQLDRDTGGRMHAPVPGFYGATP
jgi:hypothetical protein